MFRVREVEGRLRYLVENQEGFLIGGREYLSGPVSQDSEDSVVYGPGTSRAVLTVDNTVGVSAGGEEKFANLRREVEKATQYIYIQYYTIENDEVLQSTISILVGKTREGVEMRIPYDGMGGRLMPERARDQLKKSDTKVREFFPAFLGRLQLRVNYRNHRKIVMIDGRTAYVGRLNVGRKYISEDPRFGYWRDARLRISDGAVYSLQIRFAPGQDYAIKENLFKDVRRFGLMDEMEALSLKAEMMFQPMACKVGQRPLGIRITTSGLDSNIRQTRSNYLESLHKARRTIYAQTPYFIPDDAMFSALQIAARVDVDVRLMILCKPDHPSVCWATYSYVGDLLETSVRCYTYGNGFLYAKGVMIDSMVCCYGMANMDIRGFELNSEVNAAIHDEEATKRLGDIFLKDLENRHEMMESYYMRRSLWIRAKEQCSRLSSPSS